MFTALCIVPRNTHNGLRTKQTCAHKRLINNVRDNLHGINNEQEACVYCTCNWPAHVSGMPCVGHSIHSPAVIY